MIPIRCAGAILCLVSCALAACSQQPVAPGASAMLKGTATYRERMAMPVDAVFEATLEDVSVADAKSEVLGRVRIERPGNPPIAFEITYDPARIEPRRRYAVRARILVGDRLFFTTDAAYPALAAGQSGELELLLRRTSVQAQASDEPLENTYWKLTSLGNASVRAAANQQEAHFILRPADRRVSGSGGCNRLTGSYERDGSRLTFGRMASTMMACQDAMETERNFLSALSQVRAARVTRNQLELLDASGRAVAQFEAVHLR